MKKAKKVFAGYACGVLILFGLGWGSMVLLTELAYATTSPLVAWMPSMYALLIIYAIFATYIYGLIKMIAAIADWADI